MRVLLAVLLASGCNRAKPSPPPPPDPRAFAAMDSDAKCAAIAPRTEPCADALEVADAKAILGSDTPVADKLAKSDPSTPDEARVIVHSMCLGDKGFADRVVKCWSAPTCEALARCAVASP